MPRKEAIIINYLPRFNCERLFKIKKSIFIKKKKSMIFLTIIVVLKVFNSNYKKTVSLQNYFQISYSRVQLAWACGGMRNYNRYVIWITRKL